MKDLSPTVFMAAIARMMVLAVLASLAGTLCFAAAATAGPVEVKWTQPERYTDVGWLEADRVRNLEALRRHFEGLGARLPAGQTLVVEILDVDLAGEEIPGALRGERVRVLKGRADWPRMRLRYTFTAPGQPARSGEETLADMAYLQRVLRTGDEPLPYEARMVDEWFEQRIVQGLPAR